MPQVWNPDRYARHARFVSDLGMPVVELLAPTQGERVLDLGCGDGALTRKLADRGCVVVGVDASPDMIERARQLGLDAHVMDGHALPFENEFDAVFSNAALHWMKRPDDVIAGVWRALKSGGRFVGEFGGEGNVAGVISAVKAVLESWGIDPSQVDPWYFPSVDEYRSRLEAQGFTLHEIALIPRPTRLPSDMTGWLETFAKDYLALVPDSRREEFFQQVCGLTRPKLQGDDGVWWVDYVRLRFFASKGEAVPLTR